MSLRRIEAATPSRHRTAKSHDFHFSLDRDTGASSTGPPRQRTEMAEGIDVEKTDLTALLESAIKGESEALGEVLIRFRPLIYKKVVATLRMAKCDRFDILDCVDECSLRIVKNF